MRSDKKDIEEAAKSCLLQTNLLEKLPNKYNTCNW